MTFTSEENKKAVTDLVRAFEMSPSMEKISLLQPDSVFVMNPTDSYWKDIYESYGMEFKELVKLSLFVILQKQHQGVSVGITYDRIKIQFDTKIDKLLRHIGPKDTGKPVTFDATVLSVDARKAFVKKGLFKCPICEASDWIESNEDRKIPSYSTKCSNPKCKREQMIIDSNMSLTEYIQTVIIQEPLEEAENNSPVTFVAKIVGNQVGEAFTTQKKRITGVFKSYIDIKKIEQDVFIDIIEMKDLEEKSLIIPSDEQIMAYKELTKGDEWIPDLIGSFAPHIWGYKDIKLSILLLLAGGVRTNKRGEINMLLVGDPSMAKTEMLKFGESITQKSAYTTGKGSSGVGLTIAVIKEENLGRFMATPGVYPLCNEGYVFVDEFDKMNNDDRSSMHEVLEHGMCSVAKAGIKLSLPARVATLAASNPKYGKYDPDMTLAENIDLMPTLLSRMDMIWLIRDMVNELDDTRKAEYILEEYTVGNSPHKGKYSPNELMSIINHVKQLKPTLCDEAKEKLLIMYKKMRNMSDKKDVTPIGIRQLEGLIRLCMAHAKLRMRNQVQVDDIDEVLRLFKASFLSYGVDLDKGGIQTKIFDPKHMDKEQEFWHIWKSVEHNGEVDKVLFVEKAIVDSVKFKSEGDIIKYWDMLENKASKIMTLKSGRFKKT